jgi:hypothetical protein
MAGLQAAQEIWGEMNMPLTRDFIETIKARADRDAEFRRELLSDGVETFLSGDIETGKAILRDYINATVGFGPLGKALDIDPKSLMRMLGPSGNPKTGNFIEIISDAFTLARIDRQSSVTITQRYIHPQAGCDRAGLRKI